MKNRMKRILIALSTLWFAGFNALTAVAQQAGDARPSSVEMADSLRADGKIYVVVLVVAILFTFLMVYMLLTDRQVKKLEKEVTNIKNRK